MKKVLSETMQLVMMLLLVFSLAGCNKTDTPNTIDDAHNINKLEELSKELVEPQQESIFDNDDISISFESYELKSPSEIELKFKVENKSDILAQQLRISDVYINNFSTDLVDYRIIEPKQSGEEDITLELPIMLKYLEDKFTGIEMKLGITPYVDTSDELGNTGLVATDESMFSTYTLCIYPYGMDAYKEFEYTGNTDATVETDEYTFSVTNTYIDELQGLLINTYIINSYAEDARLELENTVINDTYSVDLDMGMLIKPGRSTNEVFSIPNEVLDDLEIDELKQLKFDIVIYESIIGTEISRNEVIIDK